MWARRMSLSHNKWQWSICDELPFGRLHRLGGCSVMLRVLDLLVCAKAPVTGTEVTTLLTQQVACRLQYAQLAISSESVQYAVLHGVHVSTHPSTTAKHIA